MNSGPGSLGIFSLDRYDVQHLLSFDQVQGLRIVTDPRRWAHAVEFKPLVTAEFERGAIVVDLEIDVESGEIEVGALSTTGSTFLSQRRATTGSHVIELAIPELAQCRGIVVRNAAASSSVVRVTCIRERRTSSSAPTDDFDFSAPYGSCSRGFWDKNIFADVRRLAGATARVVFQGGAHHGEEATSYLSLFPKARVYCVEPGMAAFETLQRRLGSSDRAELLKVALGEHVGDVPFYENRLDETNSLFRFGPAARRYLDPSIQGAAVQVPCTTIDQLIQRFTLDTIDVLHLDTQGAELAILRGASTALRARRIKVVIAEVIFAALYDGQATPHELMAFLATMGYRVYDFYNFAYSESGELLWGDAIFLHSEDSARAN